MRGIFASWLLAALSCTSAQALTLTQVEVEAGAEKIYRERLEEARSRYELDADAAFLERVTIIARKLIAQAGREYGIAVSAWEMHTTSSADENASSMAGGKLLIGQAYVQRLQLTDDELAMLIAHEIAHVVLQHNLKEMREALRLEPGREQQPFADLEYAIDHDQALMRKLADFDREQEFEADREGMLLAAHAGWPPARLANYFKKLVRNDPSANADRFEHPAPARRWRAAQVLARELGSS